MVRFRNITFKPKIRYDDVEYYLHNFDERQIENDEIYELMEKLLNLAYPTYEDQYDKRWEYFYIPVIRHKKTIAIPVWAMEYNKEFFIQIQSIGRFHVLKGNKKIEKIFCNIITEIIRFVPFCQIEILQKIIPYDIRTGKIKGVHILEDLLPQEKKKNILECYEKYIEKNNQVKECSLNDYLNTASICYIAAYKEEAGNLSPSDMYKKWADGRDGGMLSIMDWNNKNEFAEWLHSAKHLGSHPFEIVFSWHEHGIHLYPPDYNQYYYRLRVTNLYYANDFLKMLIELIKKEIPFKTENLENVLDFLAGETYFTVNIRGEHYFMYIHSKEYKRKYFPNIEWDEIKVLNWK